ncbi:uncharacterized protein LOC126743197 [Anthonomus grandis grandis]|uniref:uncharacterized protein LOC126743197 n=1 Tax=Anthonomus grandis grandis TaxID=2921223 RepID=UPI002165E778|nr:uncharacterized protein LOC126743197 [Anthonomus grandis grandis]
MANENPNIYSEILWTDEATFTRNGGVNLHNMHYWSETNPHWIQQVQRQGRWSVNVWCGVLGGKIIGPFIFQRVNGAVYLNFLSNELPPPLEEVPLAIRRDRFYQHDGCPSHFARDVRQFLDLTYPARWIGRGSVFPWPPRSPDLTVLDFYLWGRIKHLVFATRPTTSENMVERIREAIESISVADIETAVLLTRQRLLDCIQNDGQHFEHLGRH